METSEASGPARRSTSQVRVLLLDAAAREFAERGYDAASLRSITRRAGVSLSVFYRHFENKEQLYLAALLDPFRQAFDQFAAAWRRQLTHGWDDEEMVHEFVEDLYGHISAHREPLLQLLALQDHPEPGPAAGFRDAFAAAFGDLTRMSEREAAARGWPEPSVSRHSVWLAIVTVVGQVMMEPWSPTGLLRASPYGTGVDVPDLLTRLLLHGVRLGEHG